MFRWIFGLLIFAGAAWGGIWLMKHPQLLMAEPEKAATMPTATVDVKDVEEALFSTGEVRPAESTMVKSEVSAMIMKVHVNPGDPVKKDDLLVTLDRRELQSQFDAEQLTIKGQQLRLDQAKKEWDRNCQLWAKKLVPEKDYLDSKTAVDVSENDMAIQRARIETIQQQLNKTEIHAPHDGVVLNLDAQEGSVIVGANSFSAGTVLMEIADMSRKKINVDVNEIDVMKLKKESPVELTFDSAPGLKVEGKVTFVSPSAGSKSRANDNSSRNSGGGSGSGRTFPVTLNLESADPRIRPGITATIKIPLAKVEKVTALPIATVFVNDEDDQRYVYIKTGAEKFERKNIKTGINDHQFVEVKEGLKKGDIVAKERPKDAAEKKKKPNEGMMD